MLKTLTPLLGAFLLAGATSLYAQTTPPSSGTPDATKQERRDKMKAAHQQAKQACQGKEGTAHRDCMRTEFCKSSKDAAKCEARMKEHAAAFNKAYDACKAKATGDEFRTCMHQQHVDSRGGGKK
jgi:hypothetical protein